MSLAAAAAASRRSVHSQRTSARLWSQQHILHLIRCVVDLSYDKLYDKSTTRRKSTANQQHSNMSRWCTACCKTCCPTNPQQIGIVEFGLKTICHDNAGQWTDIGKGKAQALDIALLTWVTVVTKSALQSRKWRLIGMSWWYRSALRGHPLPASANNWTAVHYTDIPPPQSTALCLHPVARKLLLISHPARRSRLRLT